MKPSLLEALTEPLAKSHACPTFSTLSASGMIVAATNAPWRNSRVFSLAHRGRLDDGF